MANRQIKKIVFIEPKSPGFHVYSKWGLPRLGIIILGTILNRNGYDIKIFVEEIDKIDFNDVFSADAVGISTITSTAPRAYEMAKQIKKLGIPVFMGGPHVTFLPDEALNYCDYVIRGEADDTIVDFLECLKSGIGFESIMGLSYRLGDKTVHNKSAPYCTNLDNYSAPDFSLVHGYDKSLKKLHGITPILTSRGCPFACNFCAVTQMFGRRYRFRSIENVIEELKLRKPEWIFFYDDNFAANKEHTKQLLRRILEEKLTTPWGAQVRIDIAQDDELLDLMIQTKCDRVYIGFESINPNTLKQLRKNQTLTDIETAISKIHSKRIKIHGMFIFGADHDGISTIHETVKFAKKMKIETVQFMMLIPLPGTPLFKIMEQEDRLLLRDWSYYDGHHVVFKPKKMSFLDLQRETVKAMIRFYSLPQILKSLNKFDILTMVIRIYGRRVTRKWRRSNKEFIIQLKSLYRHAGEGLTSAGTRLESSTRKTAEDIRDVFKKHSRDIKSNNVKTSP